MIQFTLLNTQLSTKYNFGLSLTRVSYTDKLWLGNRYTLKVDSLKCNGMILCFLKKKETSAIVLINI